jgi:hypothetical protein
LRCGHVYVDFGRSAAEQSALPRKDRHDHYDYKNNKHGNYARAAAAATIVISHTSLLETVNVRLLLAGAKVEDYRSLNVTTRITKQLTDQSQRRNKIECRRLQTATSPIELANNGTVSVREAFYAARRPDMRIWQVVCEAEKEKEQVTRKGVLSPAHCPPKWALVVPALTR